MMDDGCGCGIGITGIVVLLVLYCTGITVIYVVDCGRGKESVLYLVLVLVCSVTFSTG